MPVRPVDLSSVVGSGVVEADVPTENIIADALGRRLELKISTVNLHNRDISRVALNNALSADGEPGGPVWWHGSCGCDRIQIGRRGFNGAGGLWRLV